MASSNLNRMDNSTRRRLLGRRIRTLRVEAGLTQRELALMAGTSQSHLWNIERGSVDISFDLICRIAEALDAPARDLFDF